MPSRIVILGNKNLAVFCTAHLLALGEEIVSVVLNPDDDGEDRHGYLSLKKFCLDHDLPRQQPTSVSAPDCVDRLAALQPDFIFSMSYSRLIKKNFLERFPARIFNMHFALLPKNRGCLPLIYALAEGEKEAGVTLHAIDEGIDTGDIVAQEALPISDVDTARSLYFRAVAAGTKLFAETFPAIQAGTHGLTRQNDADMTYHPQQNPNDRRLDLQWPEEKIHAFIRAHTFPPYPGARFIHNNREVEVRMIEGQCEVSGTGSTSFSEFLHAYR